MSDDQVEDFFAWVQPVAERIEDEGRPAWEPEEVRMAEWCPQCGERDCLEDTHGPL